MAIQILGLREYIAKDGKRGVATRFFGKGWSLPKVEDVFSELKIGELLQQIPEEDHWNLYFTVADCVQERELNAQWAIPFDVDNVVATHHDEKVTTACRIRDLLSSTLVQHDVYLAPEAIGCLWSGHGVQLFVFLNEPITDKKAFSDYGESYKSICKDFSTALRTAGVEFGVVDTTVFSHARLMRLPNTTNRKVGKDDARSFLVGTCTGEPVSLFLKKEEYSEKDTISDSILKSYPPPDTNGVLEGCEFIKWSKVNQNQVTEPQWYALLSNLVRLENGMELCHEYSRDYKNYSEHETTSKAEQSLENSGPRTCEYIDGLWGKCRQCPNYQAVKSPILLKGPNYIASEASNFRLISLDKNGNPKPGKLNYDDLVRAFLRDINYRTQVVGDGPNGHCFWMYKNNIWQRLPEAFIEAWVDKITKGHINSAEVAEFIKTARRRNQIPHDFFHESSLNYKQFKNCVLDMRSRKIIGPSPDLGICVEIPHMYDANAECPTWDRFLNDVCLGNEDKIRTLNEFVGYILFSNSNWIAKALILVGSGANGKSVFTEVVEALVGEGNFAAIPMERLHEPYSVAALENKLLNSCKEVSYRALRDTSTFKDMVAGATMTGRNVYEKERAYKIRAKFILSCNEIPPAYDLSVGFGRRPLVVNFDAEFMPDSPTFDPFIKDKILKEIPGIFNRALKSYEVLQARGSFLENGILVEEKKKFMQGTNCVTEFVDLYFELGGEEHLVSSSILLSMAKQFSAMENIDVKAFNAKRLAFEIKRKFKKESTAIKRNGKVFRGYRGIKIKDEIDMDKIAEVY